MGMVANANLIITVEDTAVVPTPKKKTGLAKTGGTRPDVLFILGLIAIAAAGGLRVLSRKN
jgi:LPXTG-motif cell wall-anchored protein